MLLGAGKSGNRCRIETLLREWPTGWGVSHEQVTEDLDRISEIQIVVCIGIQRLQTSEVRTSEQVIQTQNGVGQLNQAITVDITTNEKLLWYEITSSPLVTPSPSKS